MNGPFSRIRSKRKKSGLVHSADGVKTYRDDSQPGLIFLQKKEALKATSVHSEFTAFQGPLQYCRLVPAGSTWKHAMKKMYIIKYRLFSTPVGLFRKSKSWGNRNPVLV